MYIAPYSDAVVYNHAGDYSNEVSPITSGYLLSRFSPKRIKSSLLHKPNSLCHPITTDISVAHNKELKTKEIRLKKKYTLSLE